RTLSAARLEQARSDFAQLESQARRELAADAGAVHVTRLLELRAGDSDVCLSVSLGPLAQVHARFRDEHQRRFGFAVGSLQVIVESLRGEARRASADA